MKVLILGDTHGVLDSRIEALAQGCAHVVHTGDVGAAEVLERLAAFGAEVHAVRGNNDVPAKWPKGERTVLDGLPAELRLELPGGALVVEHGHRANPAAKRHEVLRRRHSEARAIAYGHSHRLLTELETTPWVLNPGAAGRARTHGGPSALVLRTGRSWSVEAVRFEPEISRAAGSWISTGRNTPAS